MREMKNSGIEWIGEIPSDWKTSKLKHCLSKNDGGVWGDDPTDSDYDKVVLRSTEQTIDGKWHIVSPAQRYLGHFVPLSFRIHKNDLLITKSSGSSLHIGKTTLADEFFEDNECYYSNFLQRLHTNGTLLPKFLWYLLNNPIAREQFVWMQNSTIGIGNINSENINNILIALPSTEEQTRIANFLDSKCAEIDALMADIQAQIDTLEQYKRSVITEAVTKGLSPDAEMKDSGIEWIGEIPAHWNIHPVGFYFGERKNRNRMGSENNLLSLSYGRVIRKDINSNGGLLPESFNTYNIVEENDIIIRPTDLQNDKRSLRTGLVREHGIITSAYICLYPLKNLDSRYFHFLLHSYDVMKVFYNMGNGVRQGLNYSEFARLMVFEPQYDEQVAIANFLEQKTSEIDDLMSQKRNEIETLEAYKKSLIYEYVTGKKEVIL